MTIHARVAVIGGGVIGCSIIYHLTDMGWCDAVLLEKTELTAGSTWHAAGNGHSLNADPTISRMIDNTFNLWESLEKETGQATGFHNVGGLNLAGSPDRMDEIRRLHGIGRRLGYDYEILTPEEINVRYPYIVADKLLGGLYDKRGGHTDPSGLTSAYAIGARNRGAKIYRNTRVERLEPQPDGSWLVHTSDQTVHADIIINAAGFWANEIAEMTGAVLPMCAMQHHYIVFDRIDEIVNQVSEPPIIRDADNSCYIRREGEGLLVGIYENQSHTFGEDGIPPDFGMELLPNDLDRLFSYLEKVMERVPCLAETDIKRIVNGPFCFTPDVLPLLGWMPEQRNHFCAAGWLAGIAMGGGGGRWIAEWLVNGQPGVDLSKCDVARFGAWASRDYTLAKAHEAYANRFHIHYPGEEKKGGRPLRKTPIYERQKAKGAVFGTVYGWERPLWFATDGMAAEDGLGFRQHKLNWFDMVGEECRALRNGVGVIDLSAFANYEVRGADAEAFLDGLVTNKLPGKSGRLMLAPMLDHAGGIIGDFSVIRHGPEHFSLLGGGALQGIHERWFRQHLPGNNSFTFRNTSNEMASLGIAGPASRDLLARLTGEDVSSDGFRFLDAREMTVGGIIAMVIRVSFTGDLGYEIHVKMGDLGSLYDALFDAGSELGLRDVGSRAMDSLRLEKGYPRSGTELTSDQSPLEVGLDFAVKLDKGDFIGRDAVLQRKQEGLRRELHMLVVDVDDCDAITNEPVLKSGQVVGVVTSGGYAHFTGQSLALALLEPGIAVPGDRLDIEIMGEERSAVVLEKPPFDPRGIRQRA